MDLSTRGAFRLFQVAGIDVFLHWSWFLVAFWQVTTRRAEEVEYEVLVWKVAEYVSLFGIVLLHEFGHALACRSVGGRADKIVLWPLGGVAYVSPPPRPGPLLWSIVCGPLVNLVLAFPLWGMCGLANSLDWNDSLPDLYLFLHVLTWMNLAILVLNLVPVYPLDGGQIVHALLWYWLGRWRSLQVVGCVGIFVGGVLFLLGLLIFLLSGVSGAADQSFLGGILAVIAMFVVLRSVVAFQQAATGLSLLELPRRDECACPECQMAPPRGDFWVCDHCQTRFDLFGRRGQCPACGAWYLHPDCVHCRKKSHIDQWFGGSRRPSLGGGEGPSPHAHEPEAS